MVVVALGGVAPSLQPQYAGNVYIEGTDEGAATGGGDAGYGNNYLTNANNEEDVDEDFYEEEEGGVEEEEGKALSADPKPIGEGFLPEVDSTLTILITRITSAAALPMHCPSSVWLGTHFTLCTLSLCSWMAGES